MGWSERKASDGDGRAASRGERRVQGRLLQAEEHSARKVTLAHTVLCSDSLKQLLLFSF